MKPCCVAAVRTERIATMRHLAALLARRTSNNNQDPARIAWLAAVSGLWDWVRVRLEQS